MESLMEKMKEYIETHFISGCAARFAISQETIDGRNIYTISYGAATAVYCMGQGKRTTLLY